MSKYIVRIESHKKFQLEEGQAVTKDHNRWVPASGEVQPIKTDKVIKGRHYSSGGLGKVIETGEGKPFAGKKTYFARIEINHDFDVNENL